MSGAGFPPAQEACLRHLADAVDEAFVHELLDDLRADGGERVAELEAALAACDASTLERAAHTLASMALSLGFDPLGEMCRQVERDARDGRLPEPARMEEIRALFAESSRAAATWPGRGSVYFAPV